MIDPQELANKIGAAHRATETAAEAGDLGTVKTLLIEQHQNLRDAFAYLRDETDVELDWDQVAGNPHNAAKGGYAAAGGNPKDAPPAAE